MPLASQILANVSPIAAFRACPICNKPVGFAETNSISKFNLVFLAIPKLSISLIISIKTCCKRKLVNLKLINPGFITLTSLKYFLFPKNKIDAISLAYSIALSVGKPNDKTNLVEKSPKLIFLLRSTTTSIESRLILFSWITSIVWSIATLIFSLMKSVTLVYFIYYSSLTLTSPILTSTEVTRPNISIWIIALPFSKSILLTSPTSPSNAPTTIFTVLPTL